MHLVKVSFLAFSLVFFSFELLASAQDGGARQSDLPNQSSLERRAHAHRHPDPEMMFRHRLEQLTVILDLSQDQQTQVAQIFRQVRVELNAMNPGQERPQAVERRPEFRARFREIRSAATSQVRRVLTAPQQLRFDALERLRQRHRQERRSAGLGHPHP
ncbi:MAG: hypothetical protein AAF355_05600 [Myxococcota bacterium]